MKIRANDRKGNKKNDDKIFDKVTKDGKLDTATKNCEYMEKLNKNGQA